MAEFKKGDYVLYVVCKRFRYPAKVVCRLANGDYQIIASIAEAASTPDLNLTEIVCSSSELEPMTFVPGVDDAEEPEDDEE